MQFFSVVLFAAIGLTSFNGIQNPGAAEQKTLAVTVKSQVSRMGQALIKGDYKTFTHYNSPEVIKMMGSEQKMITSLQTLLGDMKSKGMTFKSITFGEVSPIIKNGSELECTLPQHTDIGVGKGGMVMTSTLIAISKDRGISWTFLDTNNKTMAMVKQVLPNLSSAIVLPAQQAPKQY